jgi:hypothetical protein
MAAWVIAAIARLPQRARRVVVAAAALLLLAGAITSLTLQAGPGREARRPAVTVHAPAHFPAPSTMPRHLRPPVFSSDLRLARRVAGRFLLSYLKFAYGRARAASVEAVTPGMRSRLVRARVQVTPAERHRHPLVVSLTTLGTTPDFVVATATIEDGGITAFRLRLTLREQADRWLVSSVQEG